MTEQDAVRRHYERDGLVVALEQALRSAGADLDQLTIADLAQLDEFHIRARAATEEIAARLQPQADWEVLDLGSGVGGPSRYLAATYGCRVTGIDLVPAYGEAARWLAERVGLAHRVRYEMGDALDLPYPDGVFDLVWTQHVAMNIADKPTLYRGVARVLKPGGLFAIYDVVQGDGGPVIYPVPWAGEASASHLVTAGELEGLLRGAGFEIVSSLDHTPAAKAWHAALVARLTGQAPRPMALALFLGARAKEIVGNLGRNLQEERIGVVEVIARKPV